MINEEKDMNNIEEEDTIIVLTDEDGNDVEFEFLDNVEYEGNLYVVMIPVEDEDAGVVIMLLEEGETEDEDSLLTVTDEDIVEAVYEIFKENNKDVFEFEED